MRQKAYMWVNNNPLQYSDPSGYCGPLLPLCVWFLTNLPELTAAGVQSRRFRWNSIRMAERSVAVRVIGGNPQYLNLGSLISAKTFNIPPNIWKEITN